MARFKGNPILGPIPGHHWESRYVFNPAMFEAGGRVHFLYRAMGEDMISRIGYASSTDGYKIDERLKVPVFEPLNPCETRGVEDPRVTVMGANCLMTYTAFGGIPQIGITSIAMNDILEKKWVWRERVYPFPGVINKNSALFPRKMGEDYVLFHRIDPNICIAYSKDLTHWSDSGPVMRPRENHWDCLKIGIAGQPLELKEGWLQIYHGVDYNRIYRLGALLLDTEDPKKILYRSEEPFLEPLEDYECNGLVPNVVFSCGAVIRGDEVLISYGASDSVICVSNFKIDELLK
jgi:predicted GH43/DUF377 family glycosyl hydrolase